MPFGCPVAGSFCASTMLPRLMAARTLPVGARSFRTSGETVLMGLPCCGGGSCADAAVRPTANAIIAAHTILAMPFLGSLRILASGAQGGQRRHHQARCFGCREGGIVFGGPQAR